MRELRSAMPPAYIFGTFRTDRLLTAIRVFSTKVLTVFTEVPRVFTKVLTVFTKVLSVFSEIRRMWNNQVATSASLFQRATHKAPSRAIS